jgi:hypothetical protein
MKKTIHPALNIITKNGTMPLTNYLRKFHYGFITKDFLPFVIAGNRFEQCLKTNLSKTKPSSTGACLVFEQLSGKPCNVSTPG